MQQLIERAVSFPFIFQMKMTRMGTGMMKTRTMPMAMTMKRDMTIRVIRMTTMVMVMMDVDLFGVTMLETCEKQPTTDACNTLTTW